MEIALLLTIIEWSSIFVSALSGSIEARKHDFDFFGTLVIAFVCSIGGGTLRDILLDRHPIFWMQQPVYVTTVLLITLVTLPVKGTLSRRINRLFIIIDALGLGLLSYLGVSYALASQVHPVVAPALGIINATFGGVLRDMFFAQVPNIFKRTQLYAVCAFLGSTVYILLMLVGASNTQGLVGCLCSTVALRLISVKFDIRLPV